MRFCTNYPGTDFSHHNLLFRFKQQSNPVSVGSDYLPLARFIYPTSEGSCCIGSLLSDHNDDYSEPNPNCLGSNQSIPIPAVDNDRPIYFLGSCNGLILISMNWKELYLWNPSTRKAKNILNASFPQATTSWERRVYKERCGFGYNELTDDYKVICSFYNRTPQGYETFLYSSRTDSWKKIQNSLKTLEWPAKFVNGRLHWLTKERKVEFHVVTNPWNIVSLDLVEVKYQILAPPPPYYNNVWPSLAELGGYLSLICYNRIRWNGPWDTLDVWVMKKESWSKIWTFSNQVGGGLPKPIWLKKNGDIVVTCGSDLVVYRGKDKLRQSRVDNMRYSALPSIVYVESLAAPISDDKQLPQ